MTQLTKSKLDLWSRLKNSNLVTGEMPEAHVDEQASSYAGSWAIRTMQGFAGWMAAIFLIAFIGSVFSFLFRGDTAVVLTSLGIGGCVLAYVIFGMSRQNDFIDQLGLVFNLAGQFMFTLGLYQLINDRTDHHYSLYFISLFLFQVTLVMLIPNFISRLLSTWFGLICLFFAFASYGIYGLSSAIVAIIFVLLWMNETQWGKYRSFLEPVGYGVALSLIHLIGEVVFGIDFRWFFREESVSWLSLHAEWIRVILLNVAMIWFLFKISKINQLVFSTNSGILFVSCGVLLMLMGVFIPGVSGAMLLLLVGFSVKRPILITLGLVSLMTFISWYYYNLSLTLLHKSLILMATGTILIACVYLFKKFQLIRPEFASNREAKSDLGLDLETEIESEAKTKVDKTAKSINNAKWVVIGVMLFTIVLVNFNIYNKEMVLANGQLVYLKLAPVDPRSIMQGDYMRLRFDIETYLSEDDKKLADSNKQSSNYFVVNLDNQSVATYSHLYKEDALAKAQVKMQYRIKHGRIYLATHAFFFEEGTASEYEKAKYGEFRVAANGELLLNSLRDESLNVLGLNRPEN
jgi:uncharacterized membrane-anchored protein